MDPVFSQLNSSMNHSMVFDPYCFEFPVGPIIWAILSTPCACVGVPVTVWLLWVLIQRQQSNSVSSNIDVYLFNLTVMELLYSINIPPYNLNLFLWKHELLMKILDFFYASNGIGRPLLMACMCLDCYVAVCFPILYVKMKHTRYRLIMSALVWALTLAFGALLFFCLSIIPNFILVIPYFVTLPVIVGCDIAILCALRKPDPSGKTDVHSQKKRALLAIKHSLVLTVLAFLPPLVAFVFIPLLPLTTQEVYCSVGMPSLIAASLASVLMPLLYLHNLGCFKDVGGCGCGERTTD